MKNSSPAAPKALADHLRFIKITCIIYANINDVTEDSIRPETSYRARNTERGEFSQTWALMAQQLRLWVTDQQKVRDSKLPLLGP